MLSFKQFYLIETNIKLLGVTLTKFANADVDENNYKKFPFSYDKKLKDMTDEELLATAYHVRDIYKGSKGHRYVLGKMEISGISREIDKRIIDRNKW